MKDDERRTALFDGQLFVYSPTKSSLAFVEFARRMIKEAFGGRDPETAQFDMPVEQYAQILVTLKPGFIHLEESKDHLRAILKDFDCDLDKVYFDVSRMRTSTSDNYLTTGIAYAWHPHGTPGIRLRPVRSIGGFPVLTFAPITRWHSIRATGIVPSRTGQKKATTTISGIRNIEVIRWDSISRKTRVRCRNRRNSLIWTRRYD
jgi:hypothetical protein